MLQKTKTLVAALSALVTVSNGQQSQNTYAFNKNNWPNPQISQNLYTQSDASNPKWPGPGGNDYWSQINTPDGGMIRQGDPDPRLNATWYRKPFPPPNNAFNNPQGYWYSYSNNYENLKWWFDDGYNQYPQGWRDYKPVIDPLPQPGPNPIYWDWHLFDVGNNGNWYGSANYTFLDHSYDTTVQESIVVQIADQLINVRPLNMFDYRDQVFPYVQLGGNRYQLINQVSPQQVSSGLGNPQVTFMLNFTQICWIKDIPCENVIDLTPFNNQVHVDYWIKDQKQNTFYQWLDLYWLTWQVNSTYTMFNIEGQSYHMEKFPVNDMYYSSDASNNYVFWIDKLPYKLMFKHTRMTGYEKNYTSLYICKGTRINCYQNITTRSYAYSTANWSYNPSYQALTYQSLLSTPINQNYTSLWSSDGKYQNFWIQYNSFWGVPIDPTLFPIVLFMNRAYAVRPMSFDDWWQNKTVSIWQQNTTGFYAWEIMMPLLQRNDQVVNFTINANKEGSQYGICMYDWCQSNVTRVKIYNDPYDFNWPVQCILDKSLGDCFIGQNWFREDEDYVLAFNRTLKLTKVDAYTALLDPNFFYFWRNQTAWKFVWEPAFPQQLGMTKNKLDLFNTRVCFQGICSYMGNMSFIGNATNTQYFPSFANPQQLCIVGVCYTLNGTTAQLPFHIIDVDGVKLAIRQINAQDSIWAQQATIWVDQNVTYTVLGVVTDPSILRIGATMVLDVQKWSIVTPNDRYQSSFLNTFPSGKWPIPLVKQAFNLSTSCFNTSCYFPQVSTKVGILQVANFDGSTYLVSPITNKTDLNTTVLVIWSNNIPYRILKTIIGVTASIDIPMDKAIACVGLSCHFNIQRIILNGTNQNLVVNNGAQFGCNDLFTKCYGGTKFQGSLTILNIVGQQYYAATLDDSWIRYSILAFKGDPQASQAASFFPNIQMAFDQNTAYQIVQKMQPTTTSQDWVSTIQIGNLTKCTTGGKCYSNFAYDWITSDSQETNYVCAMLSCWKGNQNDSFWTQINNVKFLGLGAVVPVVRFQTLNTLPDDSVRPDQLAAEKMRTNFRNFFTYAISGDFSDPMQPGVCASSCGGKQCCARVSAYDNQSRFVAEDRLCMVSRVVQDWPKVSIQSTDYVLACDNNQSSNAWGLRASFMAIISAILFVYAL